MHTPYVHINLGPWHQLATGLEGERHGCKMTIEHVAERTKMTISRLVAIEEGKALPTQKELAALCRVYRCDRHYCGWLSWKLADALEDLEWVSSLTPVPSLGAESRTP